MDNPQFVEIAQRRQYLLTPSLPRLCVDTYSIVLVTIVRF